MDLDKLRAYPWGLHSFAYLVTSIMDTRKELKKNNNYILNGFSFALQVWVMEAIPVIGELLGEKINKEFTNGARCSNWKGAAKVSYQDIIIIEQSFGPKDIVYPYISRSGNFDIIDDIEFFRRDEMMMWE
ncbi:PREDICTED: uncharacterized protein LOC104772550 [Camelina sativa]|uniref:Uncharacterized protein LOC104772550 n=1 Tax=Camelina sativa TaxID=90675 RepID=A0ABM0Y4Q2_CAMSA|nr:PREDICTED: uncharacterized protein LOC104772550 [Camelina sativa]